MEFSMQDEKKSIFEDIFIGRDKEIDYFRGVLEQLENGGRIVLVTGEAGIGKTRLIFEIRKDVIKKGYEFFWGKAYFDSSEPYLPFKEIFENYLGGGKDENIKMLVNMANSSFYTGTGARVEDKRSFESQRNSMWWEITERIKDIASIRPLVIFIDDLQWADRATLQFLLYFGDHIKDSPILLIGTVREEEISAYMNDILQRMSRMNLYEELKLKGLKERDAREIIENLVGSKNIPEKFVKLIYSRAKGNPLFIREMIREMREEGKINSEGGIYPEEDELKIPEMIEQLIQRRVKLLDKTGKKILEIGSVIGENIPYNILLSVSGMEELELLDHIDYLINLGLWYEEPNDEKLSFSHGLIQLAVYEGIPKIKRRKLHLIIAEKIKECHQKDLDKYYTELAHHYERGGDYKHAFEYYMKAGGEAEKIYAHEDAIDFYEKALKINVDKEEKFEIYNRLGKIYGIIGEYEKAENYYNRALETVNESEKEAEIRTTIGDLYEKKGEYEQAMNIYSETLKSLPDTSPILSTIYNSMSWVEYRMGNYQKSIEYAKKAMDISGEGKERVRSYHTMGTAYLDMGEYELALEFLNKSIETQRKIGYLRGLGADYNNIGVVYQERGNIGEALKYYEKSLEIIRKMGDIDKVSGIYNNMGTLYYDIGDMNKALKYSENALQIQERIGDKKEMAVSMGNIGNIYLKMGDMKKAFEFFRKSLELSEKTGNRPSAAFVYMEMGEAYLEAGDMAMAVESTNKSIKIAKEMRSKYVLSYNYVLLSRIHVLMNDVEKGLEYGEKALSLAKEMNSEIEIMQSYRVIGMAYREKREYGNAEKYLKKAIEISERLGMRGEYAINLYELGLLYRKKGDERWKEILEEANSIFEDFSIMLYVEKVNEMLTERS